MNATNQAQIVLSAGVPLRTDGPEPRVRDLDLAERAGLAKPRDIRATIKKAIDDGGLTIAGAGGDGSPASCRPLVWVEREVVVIGSGAARAVDVYHLNEEGALLILTRLRTRRAVEATRTLVCAFAALRRGELPGQRPALPSAGALAVYREACAALAEAVEVGALARRDAAGRRLELCRAVLGLDVGPAPAPLALPPGPALLSEVAEALVAGKAAVVPAVDRSKLSSARALGEPLGLDARTVGQVARAHGVYGSPDYGEFVGVHVGGRETGGRVFLYAEAGVRALLPHLHAEAKRRSAEKTEREACKARKGAPS